MGSCKIAFILNGGLGSVLIGAEYIKKFYDTFNQDNNLKIYAYLSPSRLVSDCIMRGASFITEYYTHKSFNDDMKKQYDVVIEVVFFPYIHHINVKSDISAALQYYFDKTSAFQKSEEMCRLFSLKGNVKPNIYEWGMLNNCDRFHIADPLNLLNIGDEYSYTPAIDKDTEKTLKLFNLKKKRYITLQRGTNSGFSKETVRDWLLAYYEELIKLIKRKYPQYKIVQLGESFENCEEIKGVDVCLIGKTDLEEVKVLLANAVLHIDGECGMVHLRKALKGGPSVVFMGPAPAKFFGYTDNINCEKHPCNSYCHGLTNIWYKKCLKWNQPKCMIDIKPKEVMQKIDDYFAGKNPESQNPPKTKLEEILSDKNIYLDKEWVDSWLSHQEIYDYYLEKRKVKDLFVHILYPNGWKKVPITDSPVYQYVLGNKQAYKCYMLFKNEKIQDGNVNSADRYGRLLNKLNKKYNSKSVVIVDGADVILDGQHRACWALQKFGENAELAVLKIYGSFGV